MRIENLRLVNVKSFADSGIIELGSTNVFLGPNNAGKSTVLRGAQLLQQGAGERQSDIRLGADHLVVQARIVGDRLHRLVGAPTGSADLTLSWAPNRGLSVESIRDDDGRSGHGTFPASEPDNLIYHYLSKRKVYAFDQSVNLASTLSVARDLRFLVAKVARLSSPASPSHQDYMDICRRVLGFAVTVFPVAGGQMAGRVVSNTQAISIEDMGEGVASLVGLIVDLCVADGHVFLVEEPENDLHPSALRALLDFMATRSEANQFLVSTHSNVVARRLGALPGARLFRVDQDPGDPMATSSIREIANEPSARLEALSDLGYELYDFDLFDGWLILEESSAERVIRDLLVPWFAPRLARVRTIAAGGVSKVSPAFDDFNRLFVFAHLQPQYHNRAFVIVDGDEPRRALVDALRARYPNWDPELFRSFSAPAFEHYYPGEFRTRIDEVLGIEEKAARREAKRRLLTDVLEWSDSNYERARAAFAASAHEVVELLREIDARLFG